MKFSRGWRWGPMARRSFLRLAGAAALTSATGVSAADHAAPAPTTAIWTSPFAIKTVWGYVSRHSVAAGDSFDLMLSTGPSRETVSGRVDFFRVGRQDSAGAPPNGQTLVWTSPELTVTPQPVSRTAASVGAGWPPTLWDIPTELWPAGYYSADFVHKATGERDLQIAQIVVRPAEPRNHVLLKLGTNTYQAYNAWGGHSLYPSEDESQRGVMVSFDRPTMPAFFEYEVYLARWLEELGSRNGFTLDYATDFDVHETPALLDGYALVIAGSHDEYWSKEIFDAFEHRIFRLGRNVIFAGGNTAYFQARYADVNRPPGGADFGRQLICYKSMNDPVTRRRGAIDPALLATARFRDDARRPETMLAGVAYDGWFSPEAAGLHYPYIVATTDAPFFAGLDYKPGDVAADVVGYEWDNRDPADDGRSLWDGERSRIALLPRDSLRVLFHGEPVDAGGVKRRAEAVWFRSPAGAKVFSAGSIRWAWGLGKPGFEQETFKRFNANLVLDFLS